MGTMGLVPGAELVQKLDSLRLQYPTLITAKKQDRGTTGGRKNLVSENFR